MLDGGGIYCIAKQNIILASAQSTNFFYCANCIAKIDGFNGRSLI